MYVSIFKIGRRLEEHVPIIPILKTVYANLKNGYQSAPLTLLNFTDRCDVVRGPV